MVFLQTAGIVIFFFFFLAFLTTYIALFVFSESYYRSRTSLNVHLTLLRCLEYSISRELVPFCWIVWNVSSIYIFSFHSKSLHLVCIFLVVNIPY